MQTPNPMEQFAQVMIDLMRSQMEGLAQQHRDLVIETILTGYVRMALQYQTAATISSMLRRLADDVDGR